MLRDDAKSRRGWTFRLCQSLICEFRAENLYERPAATSRFTRPRGSGITAARLPRRDIAMSNGSWWDGASDEQRRNFARSGIELAAALNARLEADKIALTALRDAVSMLGTKLHQHPARPIADECGRTLVDLLAIESSQVDFEEMLAMVG
jgi:hypothetical protein